MYARLFLVLLALFSFSAKVQTIKESVALAIIGESKYVVSFNHFDCTNPGAPKGGTLTLVAIDTFDNLNRYALRDDPAVRTEVLYDTLFATSDGEPGSYYPLIAEWVCYTEDYSWVEVALNPYARFHDGTPITARDVAFIFSKLMTEGVPQFRLSYKGTIVKAIIPLIVRIDLGQSGKENMLNLLNLPVTPESLWRQHKLSGPLSKPPLASGPYRISARRTGQYTTYSRVVDYWTADLPVNRGRWNFNTLHYDYYLDDNVAFEAFKAGAVDRREETVAKNWATRYVGCNFSRGYIIKDEHTSTPAQNIQWLTFNIQRPVFADRRVREAITLVSDFEQMNKAPLYSVYRRANSYLQNTEYAARSLPDAAELALLTLMKNELSPKVFSQVYQPLVSRGDSFDRDGLLKANALLNAAGWTVKNQRRVSAATGKPLCFELLMPAGDNDRQVLLFQHNLQCLGTVMDIRQADNSQYSSRRRSCDYGMILSLWRAMPWPDTDLRIFWASGYTHSSYNTPGVQSPVADKLIAQILQLQGNRQKLIPPGQALGRVLTWNNYMSSMWYMAQDRTTWWNKLSFPETRPIYSSGPDTWWYGVNKTVILPADRR